MVDDVVLHEAALLQALHQYDITKSRGELEDRRCDHLPIQLGPYHEDVSALMVACHYGYIEYLIKLLKKKTSHPFSSNMAYKRSLLLAAAGNHLECVCLLSRHALFNECSVSKHHGLDEFITAVDTPDFDLIQDLLNRGISDSWIRGVEGSNLMTLLILHEFPLKGLMSMIDHGASVNQHDKHGFTPLMTAVIAGRVECAQALLQMKANVNSKDKRTVLEDYWYDYGFSHDKFGNTGNGKNALMYAVNVNNIECVNLLLPHGVNLDRSDESGFTALMHAVCGGNIECLKQLLNSGLSFNINKKDSKRRTALIHAAYAGDTASVNLLLKAKADRYLKDGNYRTAFMAAVLSKNTELTVTLLKLPTEIDSKDLQGKTSLIHAAESGNVKLLELLIKKMQKSVHVKNDNVLNEALIYAQNDVECVEVLIQNGCDINYRDSNGETLLMYACHNRNSKLFHFLVKFGANLKAVDKSTTSVLMHAVESELEFVEFLLNKGVKVNSATCKGITPLMLACLQGRPDCVELLIEYGANVNAVNCVGETPLMLTCIQGQFYSLHLLSEYIKYTVDKFEESALMCDAKEGHFKCFELLLDAGADVDMANGDKRTIFLHVLQPSFHKFLKVLIDRGKIFEDGHLKKVHKRAFANYSSFYSYSQPTMVLLMESRIFKWSWYPKLYLRQQPFAAVVSGISPGVFHTEEYCEPTTSSELEILSSRNSNLLTPLQLAFLRTQPNMVRFLLVNFYFTMQDYRVLISDGKFRSTVKKYEHIPQLILLFDEITTQPWSLQTLSLINISTSISSSDSDLSLPRAEQVDSLPIPDKFKTKLKFQGPLSRLCPSDWKCIGKPPGCEKRQELLSLTQPVWPYPQNLTQCYRNRCDCGGMGLAVHS